MQQRKEGEQAERGNVGGDHVQRSGFADLLLFIFGGYQKVAGQGHDLPGKQEADTVAGQNNAGHGSRHQPEKKGHAAHVAGMVFGRPVFARIQGRAAGYQEDGE